MKKHLLIGAMCLTAMTGSASAAEIYWVDCTASTVVFQFSEDIATSAGTVTAIQIGQSLDTMDGYLTSGSTMTQTTSSQITVNLSSADQSTFSTALSNGCYVSNNAAFTNVTATTFREK